VSGHADDHKGALAIHRAKVFHAALLKILGSARAAAGKHGFSFGSEGQSILAKFVIAILSMDYEEAYVLSESWLNETHGLNRCRAASMLGANSNFTCPVCLVPKCELWNLAGKYPPRTKEGAVALLQEAKAAQTAKQQYETLLKQSIRYMTVCQLVSFVEFLALNSKS
jgi:hypothetical protein